MENKSQKTVLGYLTYINKENFSRRKENFLKSIDSFKKIKNKNKNITIVNFDNNSCKDIKKIIYDSNVFDKVYFFNDNFYDISVLFGTYFYGKINGFKYMIYTYDDILYLDKEFLLSCEKLLDNNAEIDCIRLCDYEKNNPHYNTRYTSKQINPDAINHYVSHKNNASITWFSKELIDNNEFNISDWHYTSRTSMFRIKSFEKLLNENKILPVLSFFERYAYNFYKNNEIKTGVIEKGPFKTLAQHDSSNSERLFLGDNYYRDKFVTTKDIIDIMEKIDESV